MACGQLTILPAGVLRFFSLKRSQGHEGELKMNPMICFFILFHIFLIYSVSSLVMPKMEDEFSGTDAVKNSKRHDKS